MQYLLERWHVFEILRRLFWGAYFHKYVSAFFKKYPFPGRSNRDTLTHDIAHVVKSKFPS